MMPLTVADAGTDYIVKRIGGKPEVKKHLENLGFIVGTGVSVITIIGGNVIVKVKESRVAISREMAQKIMI
ncbi:MAG: FeoA family protein [Lachnospiraceae bacterium]|nr:FeoA family protein [Lachnospiraceae bacterium]